MNKKILTLVCLLCAAISALATSPLDTISLQNTLPRKDLINSALAHSKDSAYVCPAQVSSIQISVNSPKDKTKNGYNIIMDTLGVVLEVVREDKRVHSAFFEYKGSNFDKVKAKVDKCKFYSCEDYTESTACPTITILSIYNKKEELAREFANKLGVCNFQGDMDGMLKFAQSLVPDFATLVTANYLCPEDFVNDMVTVNTRPTKLIEMKRNASAVKVKSDSIALKFSKGAPKNITMNVAMKAKDARKVRLVEAKPAKKLPNILQFTFEDILDNGLAPTSVIESANGISTITFETAGLHAGIYAIYCPTLDKGVLFIVPEQGNEVALGYLAVGL